MNIYREIIHLLDNGGAGVLATLVSRAGSGARTVGSKMLITDQSKTIGSLGGGELDASVIRQAKETLQTGEPTLMAIEPDRSDGEVCGSAVQVFLEPVASGSAVIIVGAGHVGKAVAATARQAGFRITLLDDRTPEATGAANIQCRPDAFFQELPIAVNSFVIICSRSHAMDYDVLQQALQTPAAFIGLLGSRRKRESFFSRLKESGIAEQDFDRIVTPVGLNIGAQTPQEIGVSIVAQLIEHSYKTADVTVSLVGVRASPPTYK